MLNSETGVTGKITVNGKNRSSNSENFRNVSAYIHQDDALRPYLSVQEAMTMATHLKLGFSKFTQEYKFQLVSESIRACFLFSCFLFKPQMIIRKIPFTLFTPTDSQYIGIVGLRDTDQYKMWQIIRWTNETNGHCIGIN